MTNKIKLISLVENYKNLSPQAKAYVIRVLKSLKEKSSPDKKVYDIINEWYFKEGPDSFREVDLLECELCGKPENIYQFKITNRVTGKHIWTGSKCINNFLIPVYNSEGIEVTTEEEKDKVFRATIKNHKRKAKEVERQIFLDTLGISLYKRKSSGYSIAQMKYVAKAYHTKYNGEFIPLDFISLFDINLKSKENREALKTLEPYQWVQFSPILSKSAFNEKYGFDKLMKWKCMNIISFYYTTDTKFIKQFLSKTSHIV